MSIEKNRDDQYKEIIIDKSILSKDFFDVNINNLDKNKQGHSYIYSVGEGHYNRNYNDELYNDVINFCSKKNININKITLNVITETSYVHNSYSSIGTANRNLLIHNITNIPLDYRGFIAEKMLNTNFDYFGYFELIDKYKDKFTELYKCIHTIDNAPDNDPNKDSYILKFKTLFDLIDSNSNAFYRKLIHETYFPTSGHFYNIRLIYNLYFILYNCIYYGKNNFNDLLKEDTFLQKYKYILKIFYCFDETENKPYNIDFVKFKLENDVQQIEEFFNMIEEYEEEKEDGLYGEYFKRFKYDFGKAIIFYQNKKEILDNIINNYIGIYDPYILVLYDVFCIMYTYEKALNPNNITIIISGDTHTRNFKNTLTSINGITLTEEKANNYRFTDYFINRGLLNKDMSNLRVFIGNLINYYSYLRLTLNDENIKNLPGNDEYVVDKYETIDEHTLAETYRNIELNYYKWWPNKTHFLLIMLKYYINVNNGIVYYGSGKIELNYTKKNAILGFNNNVLSNYKIFTLENIISNDYKSGSIDFDEFYFSSFLNYIYNGIQDIDYNNIIGCDNYIQHKTHKNAEQFLDEKKNDEPNNITVTNSYLPSDVLLNLLLCPYCCVFQHNKEIKINNKEKNITIPVFTEKKWKLRSVEIEIPLYRISFSENNKLIVFKDDETDDKIYIEEYISKEIDSINYNSYISNAITNAIATIYGKYKSAMGLFPIRYEPSDGKDELREYILQFSFQREYLYNFKDIMSLINKPIESKIHNDIMNDIQHLEISIQCVNPDLIMHEVPRVNKNNLIKDLIKKGFYCKGFDINTKYYEEVPASELCSEFNEIINHINNYILKNNFNINKKIMIHKYLSEKEKEYINKGKVFFSADQILITKIDDDDDVIFTQRDQCAIMGGNTISLFNIIFVFIIFAIIYLLYSIIVITYNNVSKFFKNNQQRI